MTTQDGTPPAGGDATPPAAGADGASPNAQGAPSTPPGSPPAQPDGKTATPPSADSSPSGEWKLADEHKDKPWAPKVKSEADLYKQLDNLTALAGKKFAAPDFEKATPEEKEAFLAQLRPADVTAYGLDQVTDDVMLPGVKQALGEQMRAQGIHPAQAKPILEAVAAASAKEREAAFNPDNFIATAEAVMGKGYDPKPLNRIIKSNLSPEAYEGINNMPNANLVAMHKAMKELIDAYGIKETGAHTAAGQGAPAAPDLPTTRAKLREEIAALRHRPHTVQEKQVLIDKLNATYKQTA